MISLSSFRMFWHSAIRGGDRRRSSQVDRERFDEQKAALEREREDMMRRVQYLEAEASLYFDEAHGQKP